MNLAFLTDRLAECRILGKCGQFLIFFQEMFGIVAILAAMTARAPQFDFPTVKLQI